MNNIKVNEMIEEFLYNMKIVSKRSDLTIRQYEIALKEFDKYMFNSEGTILEMSKLRARDIIERWFSIRQTEISVSSLNQRLVALSMFYQFLIGELFDVKEVTKGIPKFTDDKRTTKKENKNKFLDIEEAKNVLDTVSGFDSKLTEYENMRNQVIINIFLGCGLRISELSKLEYRHINIEESKIFITSDIAKFGKSRVVDAPDGVIEIYKRFLELRKQHKNQSDFLFISRKNNPIHTNTIRDLVAKISIEANGKKINPHGLRHTYGTNQIAVGQDPTYVSKQMGHANLEITTSIYVHQTKDIKNKANNNPMFI